MTKDGGGDAGLGRYGEGISIMPVEHVQSRILVLPGWKVILDVDLAGLYGERAGLSAAARG